MKRIMKTVQSSYLHLFNILLNQIKFSSRVIESSFSTQLKCLSSTSQFNSTLFKLSTRLKLKYSTWRDQFSLTDYTMIHMMTLQWFRLHDHDLHAKTVCLHFLLKIHLCTLSIQRVKSAFQAHLWYNSSCYSLLSLDVQRLTLQQCWSWQKHT